MERVIWARRIGDFLRSSVEVARGREETYIALADGVDIDELDEVITELDPVDIILAATLIHDFTIRMMIEEGKEEGVAEVLAGTRAFLKALSEVESAVRWARNVITQELQLLSGAGR